jgi:hypothetical protein
MLNYILEDNHVNLLVSSYEELINFAVQNTPIIDIQDVSLFIKSDSTLEDIHSDIKQVSEDIAFYYLEEASKIIQTSFDNKTKEYLIREFSNTLKRQTSDVLSRAHDSTSDAFRKTIKYGGLTSLGASGAFLTVGAGAAATITGLLGFPPATIFLLSSLTIYATLFLTFLSHKILTKKDVLMIAHLDIKLKDLSNELQRKGFNQLSKLEKNTINQYKECLSNSNCSSYLEKSQKTENKEDRKKYFDKYATCGINCYMNFFVKKLILVLEAYLKYLKDVDKADISGIKSFDKLTRFPIGDRELQELSDKLSAYFNRVTRTLMRSDIKLQYKWVSKIDKEIIKIVNRIK